MKLFLSYLKKVRKTMAFMILITLAFGVMYLLYSLPVEPFFYGCAIEMVLGIVMGAVGFFRYRQKYTWLKNIGNRGLTSMEDFPVSEDDNEELYHQMLAELNGILKRMEDEDSEKYQEMTEFYTLWVHQIKTPIAAMRLLLQREANLINSQMNMELFKIEQYVEMVLGYLRADSMGADLVIEEYSLDDMIRQVIHKYARMFILQKLSLDYSGVTETILTDEKWLVFVLEQIISNALKYTHQGKISIYMSENEAKTLVIEDTGIGIRSEDIPRVFEKGFTGYNGRQDKKSTGIGLYLSRKILRKLHHKIRIESKVGEGTKVFLGLDSDQLWVND